MPPNPLATGDALLGSASSGRGASTTAAGCGRLGWERALDPPPGPGVGGRRSAAPPGQAARRAHRRRGGAARDRGGARGGALARPRRPAGTCRPLRARTRRAPVVLGDAARRAGRAHRRARLRVGRGAACPPSTPRARRSRRSVRSSCAAPASAASATRASTRSTAITRRRSSSTTRSRSSAASTSPTSAGDRFDTPDHPARRRLGWHDVRRGCAARRWPTSPTTSRMRWREVAGEELRGPPPPAPAGASTRPGRPDRRGGHVRRRAAGRLPHPRVATCARCLGRASSSTWRTSSCGRPRSSTSSPTSSAAAGATTSAWSWCSRARPNNGQDDTRGPARACWSTPTAGAAASSPPRCARARAGARPALRPREGRHRRRPLADVGSANLNAHSLLNDTEMNVVTDDADARPRHARAALGRAPRAALDDVGAVDPRELVDEQLDPVAREQLAAPRARAARRPTGLLALPGVSRRSARLLGPLQGLVDDG